MIRSAVLPRFGSSTGESLPAYTPKDSSVIDVERSAGKDKEVFVPSEKDDDSYEYPIRLSQLSSPSRPLSHVIDLTIPSSPSDSGSRTAFMGPPSPYYNAS